MLNRIGITTVVNLSLIISYWNMFEAKSQVGPFNLNDTLLTESKIVSFYGQGFVVPVKKNGKINERRHVYYSSDSNSWIEMFFSDTINSKNDQFLVSIIVTNNNRCSRLYRPKNPFGNLVTNNGIRIGDSIDKVIKMYGMPSKSIEIKSDKSFSMISWYLKLRKGRVLRYLPSQSGDLFFSEFYFINGILSTMLFSISE